MKTLHALVVKSRAEVETPVLFCPRFNITVGSDQTFDRDKMCLIASLGLQAVPYGRCIPRVNLSPIMLTVARDIRQLVDCASPPELADGKVITLIAVETIIGTFAIAPG
jgi:hypothetical protein